jgi:alkanesulfonate monooxygenase SsuD/methylene tetrahydromethanopterin reductase-like flavin-dependent oxidoreductase (luciferase family)
MTAQTPSSVEYAARRGYPAMQLGDPIEQVGEQIAAYRQAAGEGGPAVDERGEVVPLRYVFVAETEREAREVVAPHLMEWWRAFLRIATPPPGSRGMPGYEYHAGEHSLGARFGDLDFDDLNEAGIIMVGTPDKVAELVRRHQQVGVKHIMCDFWRAGKARADRQRSMRLFGEEVRPRFEVPGSPQPAARAGAVSV